MSVSPVRLTASVLLMATLVTFGCVSPPEAEKKTAEEAVSAAKAVGAEQYASSEFAAATDALKAGASQMAAKKYGEAKTAYVKAKEQAERAAKGVEAGKVAMKSQVEQQLAETEKRWREVTGKIRAATMQFKTNQKQVWEADAKSTQEALQAAKTAIGDDPAAAKEKLGVVDAALDKWEAELKALVAPPKEAKKPDKK